MCIQGADDGEGIIELALEVLIADPDVDQELPILPTLVGHSFENTSLSCIPEPSRGRLLGSFIQNVKQGGRRTLEVVGEPIKQLEADGTFPGEESRNPRVGHP